MVVSGIYPFTHHTDEIISFPWYLVNLWICSIARIRRDVMVNRYTVIVYNRGQCLDETSGILL